MTWLRRGILLTAVLVIGPAGSFPASGQGVSSWLDTYGKSPTEFSVEEWRAVIDSAWPPSLTTDQQLELFDQWWTMVDTLFGAFHGLDFDIDEFRSQYRPEIEQGVSRGRFAAIMNHFAYRLEDLHTYVWDNGVRGTPRRKGVPVLVIGQYSNNQGFGAALTPVEDSSLVVYRAVSNHPLGLEAGDTILGYDGERWVDLYPKLMEAELPLFVNPVHASSSEANHFYLMQAAGLNWHLFDTLDVVKYATGDTLHFDTILLANEQRVVFGSDHVDVSGVEWPNRLLNDRVGHGVVEGTDVGYVYVTSWSFDAQFDIRNRFRLAVVDLWFTHLVDAIIFDFRYNTGGGALASDVWNLMFNEVTPTIGFDERANPDDHLAMREDPLRRATNLTIRPDPQTFWDRPIAVLIGPGAISAGELEARRASFHPRARLFGLPAAGGNTGSIFPNLNQPGWFGSLATSEQFLVEGHEYITRTSLEPDERVWHTKEAVAQGKDAVVEAALGWINGQLATNTEVEQPGSSGLQLSSYPNPTRATLRVSLDVGETDAFSVSVLDAMGRRVAHIFDGRLKTGRHFIDWPLRSAAGHRVAAGTYFIRVEGGQHVWTVPAVVLEEN